MSGGSVNIVGGRSATNATTASLIVAASGANATRAGDNSPVSPRATASFTWSKSVAIWIAIGAAVVILLYLIYKFVLTGARLTIV
jgi:hypothetical protein